MMNYEYQLPNNLEQTREKFFFGWDFVDLVTIF